MPLKQRWAELRDRHAGLRHVVSAWELLQRNNGNLYAGAITYFSFLALFPLLLLAVSITGFVLHAHPATQQDLFNHLTAKVPGEFGKTLNSSLHTAIANRSGVGIVGLAGVLLTGLGWIGNLRSSVDAVWGRRPPKVNFVKAKLVNLLMLAGLGVGVVVSLGLTAAGTALTDQILRGLGLDGLPGAHVLLKVLGILIAAGGDMIIFWWLLVRLPQMDVPGRIALRGTLLAAVGFEALKVVGTYTIAASTHSATAGPFAGIIAVLIWIQLVARFMLLSCAWTAVLTGESRDAEPPAEVVVFDVDEGETALSPAAVGVTLVGAGALAGAVATWAVTRPRAPRSADRPFGVSGRDGASATCRPCRRGRRSRRR